MLLLFWDISAEPFLGGPNNNKLVNGPVVVVGAV